MGESIKLKDDKYIDASGVWDSTQQQEQSIINNEKSGRGLAVDGRTVTLVNAKGEVLSTITTQDTWRGVVDNLTSTSTTTSLSANQGRVLNSKFPTKSSWGYVNSTYGIQYRKWGEVVIVSCWKNSSNTISAGTTFGTLPSGYRPGITLYVPCYRGGNTTNYYVQILTDGRVQMGGNGITSHPLLFSVTFIAA